MTRLTNDIRREILLKLLDRAFKAKVTAQVNAEAKFARAVYQTVFARELPVVELVTDRWFQKNRSFRVMIAGERVDLYFGSGLAHDPIEGIGQAPEVRLRIPLNSAHHEAKTFAASSPEDKRFTILKDARSELSAQIRQARNQAKAVLDSVGTIKRLVEIWPEVEVFTTCYHTEKPKQTALPVVQFDQMNRLLDLPPETKAA